MNPVVRNLIVCEDMLRDPKNSNRMTLVNVISTIRPTDDVGFPLSVPQICIYFQVTECRRQGTIHLRIIHSGSRHVVCRTTDRVLTFPNRPLDVVGIPFRILECTFPTPGLYDVELWFGSDCLAQQPIRVEEIQHVNE